MSVLVKGMEMPKSCSECRFFVDAWCYALDAEDWRNAYNKPPDGERLKGCPLIEATEPRTGEWLWDSGNEVMDKYEEIIRSYNLHDDGYVSTERLLEMVANDCKCGVDDVCDALVQLKQEEFQKERDEEYQYLHCDIR